MMLERTAKPRQGRDVCWSHPLLVIGYVFNPLVILMLLIVQADAAVLIKNGRFLYPTIQGSEFQKQVDIFNSAGTVAEKKQALSLLGHAAPYYDKVTVDILIKATKLADGTLRKQAIESLTNIGRADDQEDYKIWGGSWTIGELQGRIVPVLIGLLHDPDSDIELSAASALGDLPPSDKRVVKELLDATDRKLPGSDSTSLNASVALVHIASQIRRREMFDWATEIELIASKTPSIGYYSENVLQAELKAFRQDLLFHRWQWLIDNWDKLVISLAALHAFVYFGILVGTRWSTKCCRLLCDPVFSKLSVYAYPIIRNIWWVQKWILSQYIRAELQRTHRHPAPFVPMPLKKIGEEAISFNNAEQIITELKRVWIVGPPGMGKTSIVRHLHDLAFQAKKVNSIDSVVTHFGFVPIFATLRDYASVEIDLKSDPDGWIVAIVQRVLASRGVPIQDKGILKGFLRSGRIAVILDGANETTRSAEICEYAKLNRETLLLVTSQLKPDTSNSDENFAVFTLPRTVDDFIEPIVRRSMEHEASEQLISHITESGLRSDIRNGYDLRLLIDLAQRGSRSEDLPSTRLGLYMGYLELLKTFNDADDIINGLSFTAWKTFEKGERRFDIGGLPSAALEALFIERYPVLRRVLTDRAEFRHDQMRAFFAARYLACLPIDVEIASFRESEIWDQRRDEQEQLWSFVAELTESCDTLGMLWLLSLERPEYGIFQHVLQLIGKSRNCTWLPAPSEIVSTNVRPRLQAHS